MDVEFEHSFMHFRLFRKANGSALHPLEVRAEVEIFTFDVLSAVFSNRVALGIQRLGVALPIVGVEVSHLAGRQLAAQLVTTGIGATSQDKGGDVSGVAVEAIPQPVLLFLALHKTPLLIHFQGQNAWRHAWFGCLSCGLTQNCQNSGGADVQHTGYVTHTRTIERHRHNQLAI